MRGVGDERCVCMCVMRGVCVTRECVAREGRYMMRGVCVARECVAREGRYVMRGLCVARECVAREGRYMMRGVCVARECVAREGRYVMRRKVCDEWVVSIGWDNEITISTKSSSRLVLVVWPSQMR